MSYKLNPPPQRIPSSGNAEIDQFLQELVQSVFLLFKYTHTLNEVDVDGIAITNGTGSPESAVTGTVGDLFIRTDGGTSTVLYVKESGTGNTGWAAK